MGKRRINPHKDDDLAQVEAPGTAGAWVRAGASVPASVAGLTMHPVRMQPSSAVPAPEQPDQQVPPDRTIGGSLHGADPLGGDEVGLIDQPGMRHLLGDHPLVELLRRRRCHCP